MAFKKNILKGINPKTVILPKIKGKIKRMKILLLKKFIILIV
tara:strand:- start:1044 stop:1169 length:126 start_codon:yes stop_codon:yes gene_type:complete